MEEAIKQPFGCQVRVDQFVVFNGGCENLGAAPGVVILTRQGERFAILFGLFRPPFVGNMLQ